MIKYVSKKVIDKVESLSKQFKETHNEEIFNQIYNHLDVPIYNYIYYKIGDHHIASDIHSDGFTKVYINIDSYDTSKPFCSWLYGIINIGIGHYYKNKRVDYITFSEILESDRRVKPNTDNIVEKSKLENNTLPDSPTLYDNYQLIDLGINKKDDERIGKIKTSVLMECIEELPDKYKHIIYDRYILSIKQTDIGKIYDLNSNTVKSRLRKGVSDIKNIYDRRIKHKRDEF